ncbi:MAG: SGNH/GDSL hydrolase family protein [Streptosporangiaceae bacterium]
MLARRAVLARRVAAMLALCAVTASTITACSDTATAPSSAPAAPGAPAGRSYYVSLGDSLSVGVQPDATGGSMATRQGYPDQLYAVLHRQAPGLRLVKLGCSGETTATMIHGGTCRYPGGGAQLAAADRFLRAHRGRISLITIDIGANDPNACIIGIPAGDIAAGHIARCLNSTFRNTLANLATILRRLRAAAGSKVTIIGMSYYVPELAGWLRNRTGKEIAAVSERLALAYNTLLTRVYTRYHARVADVFGAFHSADFNDHVRLPGIGTVPRNVATVCEWTWICKRPPRGPNEHANEVGYGVIALAFLLADRR